MEKLVTWLLLLAAAGWGVWMWYGRHVWAWRKWEADRIEAQRKERADAHIKSMGARFKAADIMHRAEQVRRQRTGENAIYEDALDKQDELIRRACKRSATNNNTNLS